MRVLSAFALALVGAALAASPPAFSATEQPARFQASGQSKLDSAGRKLYIIQLVGDGALATPDPRLAPTRKAMRENTAQAATERKAARNAAVQSRLMAKLGPAAEQVYSYRYSFNGLALKLTPAEAQRLRRDPDVVAIWEDSVRKLSTNASPEFLGLFANDGGLIGDLGLRGEDVIIGIIDSGIAPEHPSFHDTAEPEAPRLCSTSFRDSFLGLWLCRRFEARPDVLQYESIPAGWAGSCEAGEQFSADDCNNKLIGARFFIAAAEANQQIDPREIRSPRDTDGHGTHIASTAAGNRVTARINGANVARIQGIAPRARVAAYKACWLEPGAVRASCNTADLAMAIDTAVADGVDIISYSVGNDLQTVSSADSLALLAAAKAGIFTAVAAGNDGPDLGTIGSPAGSPWVTAVAASSRAGAIFEEAIEIAAPSDLAGKIAAREANFTEPLADTGTIEGRLVVVDDGSDVVTNNDSIGTDDDGCQPYDNAADVSGNIAYVRRSGCLFSVKLDNAVDAGAEAVVVFSNAGPPVIMTSTDSTRAAIPAVMIGQATGLDLLDRLLDDDTIEVRLANGLFLSETQPGNFVGSFSSRGPSLGAPDVLKPDVTAPGIDILAALSPTRANGPQGVNYGYLTGTSMATPHIAGIAALLKEAHPDWSPAMLRSALMTSAYVDDVFRGDDVAADAFDRGAGHVDPNAANRAALVYDASAVDYDAFGCGLEPPIVAPARCTELASANVSFAAVDFNQPSLSVFRLTDARTIRRTVTNLGPTATWQAVVDEPPGFTIVVEPSVLTVGEGQSATFTATITQQAGQLDAWYFGELRWVGDSSAARLPIALKAASVDAPEEIRDAGGAGSRGFDVKFGYTGPYSARVHGLVAPVAVADFVANDPDKNFDADGCQDSGVRCLSLTVPPGELYLRLALFDEFTDGNDDLDLFLFYCPNGTNAFCPEVAASGEATAEEEINLVGPPAGDYIVLVHGFDTDQTAGGPGANFTLFVWELFGVDAQGNAAADPRGNLTLNAPTQVVSGGTENLTINWQDLDPDARYLGAISHNTPSGTVGLTIVNIRN